MFLFRRNRHVRQVDQEVPDDCLTEECKGSVKMDTEAQIETPKNRNKKNHRKNHHMVEEGRLKQDKCNQEEKSQKIKYQPSNTNTVQIQSKQIIYMRGKHAQDKSIVIKYRRSDELVYKNKETGEMMPVSESESDSEDLDFVSDQLHQLYDLDHQGFSPRKTHNHTKTYVKKSSHSIRNNGAQIQRNRHHSKSPNTSISTQTPNTPTPYEQNTNSHEAPYTDEPNTEACYTPTPYKQNKIDTEPPTPTTYTFQSFTNNYSFANHDSVANKEHQENGEMDLFKSNTNTNIVTKKHSIKEHEYIKDIEDIKERDNDRDSDSDKNRNTIVNKGSNSGGGDDGNSDCDSDSDGRPHIGFKHSKTKSYGGYNRIDNQTKEPMSVLEISNDSDRIRSNSNETGRCEKDKVKDEIITYDVNNKENSKQTQSEGDKVNKSSSSKGILRFFNIFRDKDIDSEQNEQNNKHIRHKSTTTSLGTSTKTNTVNGTGIINTVNVDGTNTTTTGSKDKWKAEVDHSLRSDSNAGDRDDLTALDHIHSLTHHTTTMDLEYERNKSNTKKRVMSKKEREKEMKEREKQKLKEEKSRIKKERERLEKERKTRERKRAFYK